mmetsp:Transcript_19162/g.43628  ORF Transcript_19162/g.43628 Transcript_19162/m.43628 type:complete len:270 (+) Transcript_19162:430-1239(+)
MSLHIFLDFQSIYWHGFIFLHRLSILYKKLLLRIERQPLSSNDALYHPAQIYQRSLRIFTLQPPQLFGHGGRFRQHVGGKLKRIHHYGIHAIGPLVAEGRHHRGPARLENADPLLLRVRGRYGHRQRTTFGPGAGFPEGFGVLQPEYAVFGGQSGGKTHTRQQLFALFFLGHLAGFPYLFYPLIMQQGQSRTGGKNIFGTTATGWFREEINVVAFYQIRQILVQQTLVRNNFTSHLQNKGVYSGRQGSRGDKSKIGEKWFMGEISAKIR